MQQALSTLKEDWNVLVQDEFIFIHDFAIVKKRRWILKEKKDQLSQLQVLDKSIIFGALSLSGKQLFRQYERFDSIHSFIQYLAKIQKRFKKFIMLVDRTTTQHRSKMVRLPAKK